MLIFKIQKFLNLLFLQYTIPAGEKFPWGRRPRYGPDGPQWPRYGPTDPDGPVTALDGPRRPFCFFFYFFYA